MKHHNTTEYLLIFALILIIWIGHIDDWGETGNEAVYVLIVLSWFKVMEDSKMLFHTEAKHTHETAEALVAHSTHWQLLSFEQAVWKSMWR